MEQEDSERGAPEEIGLVGFSSVIKKRIWVLAATIALMLAAAFFLDSSRPRLYTADAVVKFGTYQINRGLESTEDIMVAASTLTERYIQNRTVKDDKGLPYVSRFNLGAKGFSRDRYIRVSVLGETGEEAIGHLTMILPEILSQLNEQNDRILSIQRSELTELERIQTALVDEYARRSASIESSLREDKVLSEMVLLEKLKLNHEMASMRNMTYNRRNVILYNELNRARVEKGPWLAGRQSSSGVGSVIFLAVFIGGILGIVIILFLELLSVRRTRSIKAER